MFLRRKRNKTGSVSVQVIDKSQGSYRVLKSFGTGRTEIELSSLESKARQFMNEQQGLTNTLFPEPLDMQIEDFVASLSNSQLQVIGPELIFGALYDKIGYGTLNNELFRHLVITRLFNPGSKLKTIDYLHRYQAQLYSSDKIYRFLDELCYRGERFDGKPIGIKEQIETISYNHTCKVLGRTPSIVFYDMTTLYFEASDEDELRKVGFSKDGKHSCPQIFLGLLVSLGGNPIGYDIFEGNIFEGHTLIPFLEKMQDRFTQNKPIVIADSGLLSKNNIKALEKAKYKYILGGRPKNDSDDIKAKILSLSLKDGDIKTIRREDNARLIISMSNNRAKKDAHNREKGLKRLEKRIESCKLGKSSVR